MRSLDLEQLKAFVAVAEAGSISGGAGRVFRSQSAVSEQIQKLEASAGAPLLLRSRNGVALTPAGERLIGHARQMLALGELALHDVRNELRRTDVRLAISDYFRPDEIAGLLAHLARHCPQLRLQVSMGQSAVLAHGHADGLYDLALTMEVDSAQRGRAPTRVTVLRKEPLSWVAAPGLDLRGEPDLPLVLLPPTCSLHQTAVRRLQHQRVSYRIAHSGSGVAGVQAALRAGLGLGCLNASAIGPGLAIARSNRLPKLPGCSFGLLLPPGDAPPGLHEAGAALQAFFR
ncbi:LysR family transcriptional regulator [Lysobacter gummosus]|jgi:DNA-binding transcriptional LysR family regulator|uniref:LysR family transcriptional regulator n=1 Tax=Lysobacter gummosus TaxID=262324 RepID=A0ABY3XCP0_9GAMM|nr:LysR family transcriptional regulator [Lysobacter gummosus]ALN93932.1 bacterial regulatory helix-turn-helix, lysR family protein [Lysobacter gummosus]UNP29379.1 LysR family transcriptional regulator [Lysobacter gummosus]